MVLGLDLVSWLANGYARDVNKDSSHKDTVLESSRTSPRSRGYSRTILKSLVLALASRLVSLTPSLGGPGQGLTFLGYA